MSYKVKRLWTYEGYQTPSWPYVVGSLQARGRFSQCTASSGPIRVLDMPIYMEDQGWRIPARLGQFSEMIGKAMAHESQIDPEYWYAYITIDQKPVAPGGTQRRPGCHADAWMAQDGVQVDVTAETISGLTGGLPVDRTYVTYDVLPTEFFAGPFVIDASMDCEVVQRTFDEVAAEQKPMTFPEYSVLCLDPYDVHRCAVNKSAHPLGRTFVKISFSRWQYNREGNTHNPYFTYDWEMVPRTNQREHRWA